MYNPMQISNLSLSQFVSSANVNQYANRSPAKPVTIEGQLDDEKTNSTEIKTVDSAIENSGIESQTQLVLPPTTQVSISGEFNSGKFNSGRFNSVLASREFSANDLSQNESSSGSPSSPEHSFAYANRRSFEGLAGSALVIQQYLNNESSASSQPENIQANINFFV